MNLHSLTPEELDDAWAKAASLTDSFRVALERVASLHPMVCDMTLLPADECTRPEHADEYRYCRPVCKSCVDIEFYESHVAWPCDTRRALDGEDARFVITRTKYGVRVTSIDGE